MGWDRIVHVSTVTVDAKRGCWIFLELELHVILHLLMWMQYMLLTTEPPLWSSLKFLTGEGMQT